MDLLKLSVKRRFEFDLGQLYIELLRILDVEANDSEKELYTDLLSVFHKAIAAAQAKLVELMPTETGTKSMLPLCQNIWQGIQETIGKGRKEMIDVLLKNGIFVTVDLQPSMTKAVFHKCEPVFPNFDHISLALARIRGMIGMIKHVDLTEEQLMEIVNEQVKGKEKDCEPVIKDLDTYLENMDKPIGVLNALSSLRVVCILYNYKILNFNRLYRYL